MPAQVPPTAGADTLLSAADVARNRGVGHAAPPQRAPGGLQRTGAWVRTTV